MDTYQKTISIALIIIIAGTAGFWLGRAAERGTLGAALKYVQPAPIGEEVNVSGAMLIGGNAIAVNDQAPGLKVEVATVTLAQDGWVAIHEVLNGQAGNILGARRFSTGANQTGAVELLRPTEEGKVYFAMLHSDDGDRQFDHTKDLAITDPQGNIILMRFVAAAGPLER